MGKVKLLAVGPEGELATAMGAALCTTSSDGTTQGGNLAAVVWLLAQGVSPSLPCLVTTRPQQSLCAVEPCLEHPLLVAAAQLNLGAIKALLAAGADVNRRADFGRWSALEYVLAHTPRERYKDYSRAALLLLAAGADPACQRADGRGRAIDFAGRCGDSEVFAALLSAGASPAPRAMFTNLVDGEHQATIHYLSLAAERNHVGVLRLAIAAGVDVNLRGLDAHKKTLLHDAVYFGGNDAAVALIEELGADVNALYRARRLYVGKKVTVGLEVKTEGVAIESEFGENVGLWEDRTALDLVLAEPDVMRRTTPAVIAALRAKGAKRAAELGGARGRDA